MSSEEPTAESVPEPSPAAGASTADQAANAKELSRTKAAAARAKLARDQLIASRDDHASLDLALSISEHDIATGGALMAGALAFRLFLWALPAALLLVGISGFDSNSGGDAKSAGLGAVTARTIDQASEQAHHSRWYAVLLGAVLLFMASGALIKTIRVAVSLTWRQPIRKLRNQMTGRLITIAVIFTCLALTVVATWIRKNSPGLGLAATLSVAVIWGCVWWVVSSWLPHPDDLPWWGLLPGAVVVGLGAEAMHLITIYYISPRISSSSNLYGPLGIAATILLWAYLVSRLLLASIAVDATFYARNKRLNPELGPMSFSQLQ